MGVGSPFDYGDGLRSNTSMLRTRAGPLSSCQRKPQTEERSNRLLRQLNSISAGLDLTARSVTSFDIVRTSQWRINSVQLTTSPSPPHRTFSWEAVWRRLSGLACFHGTVLKKSNCPTLVPYCQLRVPGYSIEFVIMRLDCASPFPLIPLFPRTPHDRR